AAGDGAQDIARRHDALEVAVLVEHQREVHYRRADRREHRQRIGLVEHHRGRLHQRADVGRGTAGEDIDQVLAHQHADDLVRLAFVYGQYRMVRGTQLLRYLLSRVGEIDDLHIETWSHEPARGAVGKAHDARDHRALLAFQYPLALGLGNDGLDLLVS